MAKDQSYWLHKLATLKVDRSRGDPAPHKPFLVLVILEMAGRGEIAGPELPLSPDLAYRFSLFNSVIAERKRPPLELRLPFHHLKTSGIWCPLSADGTPSPHRNLTVKVRFEPSFFACLCDPACSPGIGNVWQGVKTAPSGGRFGPSPTGGILLKFKDKPTSPAGLAAGGREFGGHPSRKGTLIPLFHGLRG